MTDDTNPNLRATLAKVHAPGAEIVDSVTVPQMMKVRDGARLLAIDESSLRRLIRSGQLPVYRIGRGAVRVSAADLAALIETSRLDVRALVAEVRAPGSE